MLGNNALDGIYEDYFDFYWNGGFEVLGLAVACVYNLRYGNLAIDGDRDNPDYLRRPSVLCAN